jgi:uncharacterized protein (DUF1499 family)
MDEHPEKGEKKDESFSIITLAGISLAVLSVLAAVLSGFGSRFGLWHFRTGFEILRYSGFISLLAVIVSGVGVFLCLKGRSKGLLPAVSGIAIGLAVIVVLAQLWLKAHDAPPIHDITTDIVNPPQFVAILPLRKNATNPATYGGPEVAIKQLQAYPDIRPLILEQPYEQAFETALGTARRMGWSIVAADKKTGRIEATDTTFWFGFTDDIVVRITAVDRRSIIDVRSVSRVGRSDMGTNAGRIRKYLERLRHNT